MSKILSRYTDICKYQDLISTKSLFFARTTILEDEHEGSLNMVPLKDIIYESTGDMEKNTRINSQKEIKKWIKKWINHFEPLLHEKFVNNFTFVNCWHRNRKESSLMWNNYSKKGIMIQTTITDLENIVKNINSKEQNKLLPNINNHKKYKFVAESRNIIYPHRNELNPRKMKGKFDIVGLDRFFHKQPEYKDEKEYRVIIQIQMDREERSRIKYHKIPSINLKKTTETINKIFENISEICQKMENKYNNYTEELNKYIDENGIRYPIDPQFFIENIITSPFSDNSIINTIEEENRKNKLDIRPKISQIKLKRAPVKIGLKGIYEVKI